MKLGLKAKLCLGFGLMIALICGLGIFLIAQMGTIDGKTSEIADRWMPSIDAARSLDTATADLRIAELQHVTVIDPEGLKRWEQYAEELVTKIMSIRANYEKLPVTAEEEKLYANYKDKFARFLELHGRAMQLSAANQKDAALQIYNGESLRLFTELSEDLGKIAQLNADGGKQSSHEADEIYESALWLVIALLVAGVAVGSAVAAWIIIGIMRSVGGEPDLVRSVVTQVAQGDLTAQIVTRKGDSSSVLFAVKAMVENLLETARIADTIANGDLRVTPAPRSDKDAMGHS